MNKKDKKLEDLFTNENSASLKDFEALVKKFRQMGLQDNAKIPLSYIIQSLYKNVPYNLQKNMKEIQKEAYIEGYNEAKKEFGSKGDNTDEKSKKA